MRGRCVTDLRFQLFCCERRGRAIISGRSGGGRGSAAGLKLSAFFSFHFCFPTAATARGVDSEGERRSRTTEGSIVLKRRAASLLRVCVRTHTRSRSPGHSSNRETEREREQESEEDMKTGKKSFIGRCSLKSAAVLCDCQKMLLAAHALVFPLSCTLDSERV